MVGDFKEVEVIVKVFFYLGDNINDIGDDLLYVGFIKIVVGYIEGMVGLVGFLKVLFVV